MKVLECGKCGHVEFGEAPEHCLICYATEDLFKENPEAIKRPEDPGELTEGEKKHVPVVAVTKGGTDDNPCVTVKATVGEVEHVMEDKHFIRYIDFYLDHRFVSRIWLSPEVCHPRASLDLKAASGTVQVIENCNVHGNWLTEAAL